MSALPSARSAAEALTAVSAAEVAGGPTVHIEHATFTTALESFPPPPPMRAQLVKGGMAAHDGMRAGDLRRHDAGALGTTTLVRFRESDFPFECPHCEKRFQSQGLRKQHVRLEHVKPYVCCTCKSTFTRKFDLYKHTMTVHEKQRPFACSICDRAFGQKHHLTRHIRAVHQRTRDFKCNLCKSVFARREHLQNHIRSVHEKSKPFLCSMCDAQYSEKRALRRHLESFHRVKPTRASLFAGWQLKSNPTLLVTELYQL